MLPSAEPYRGTATRDLTNSSSVLKDLGRWTCATRQHSEGLSRSDRCTISGQWRSALHFVCQAGNTASCRALSKFGPNAISALYRRLCCQPTIRVPVRTHLGKAVREHDRYWSSCTNHDSASALFLAELCSVTPCFPRKDASRICSSARAFDLDRALPVFRQPPFANQNVGFIFTRFGTSQGLKGFVPVRCTMSDSWPDAFRVPSGAAWTEGSPIG